MSSPATNLVDVERKARSQFQLTMLRARQSRHAIFGSAILVVVIAAALAAPLLAPFDPLLISYPDQFKPPSINHLFGTDEFGRDIFSRVVHGGRYSLRVGLLSTAISLTAGIIIGLISGYFGGWFDFAVQRIIDMMVAFPGLILALVIISILGSGLQNVLIALGIGGIPFYTRLVRGQVLSTRERDYVDAARVIGAGTPRILGKYIFPSTLSPIIIVGSLDLAGNILAAAGLSFIGLGAQPPSPEWGAMLSSGRDYMRDQWWIATFPGIVIAVTVLGFNLLGDGLRDVLDPQSSR